MKIFRIASFLLTALSTAAFASTNYTYLALGDSVPFGMNVTLLPPYSQVKPTPAEFIGYPETAAALMRVSELNAACPGETSASFLDASNPDNGCNSPHVVPPPSSSLPPIIIQPFKPTYGLHAAYTGAQMDFAIAQLKANPKIDLVTLSIGANDILLALPALLQCGSDSACINNVLGPVLNTYGANLGQILANIRAQYQGTLILMTYYSPAPALDGLTAAVNGVMTQVAAQFSATPGIAPITIADGFAAFQTVSAPFGNDACQAGLLIHLPPSPYDMSPCDIHPSALGTRPAGGIGDISRAAREHRLQRDLQWGVCRQFDCLVRRDLHVRWRGVTGNITQTGGNLVLSGTIVGGNVQIQAGGSFSIGSFARILGNLQIQNLPSSAIQNHVCGVNVGGNLMFQNSNAPVQIGASTMCPGNTVHGNLQVQNNVAAVGIVSNTVSGNLQVQNDSGSTVVSGNQVAKNLQCSGNANISGSGNTAAQKQGQCGSF